MALNYGERVGRLVRRRVLFAGGQSVAQGWKRAE